MCMSTVLFILLAFVAGFFWISEGIEWYYHGRHALYGLIRDVAGFLASISFARAAWYAGGVNWWAGVLLGVVFSFIFGFWFVTRLPELWCYESEYRPWFEKKFPRFFRV